jgi:hypothetical protein
MRGGAASRPGRGAPAGDAGPDREGRVPVIVAADSIRGQNSSLATGGLWITPGAKGACNEGIEGSLPRGRRGLPVRLASERPGDGVMGLRLAARRDDAWEHRRAGHLHG